MGDEQNDTLSRIAHALEELVKIQKHVAKIRTKRARDDTSDASVRTKKRRKRRLSGYNLFVREQRNIVAQDAEDSGEAKEDFKTFNSVVMKRVGAQWLALDEASKKRYAERAKAILDDVNEMDAEDDGAAADYEAPAIADVPVVDEPKKRKSKSKKHKDKDSKKVKKHKKKNRD